MLEQNHYGQRQVANHQKLTSLSAPIVAIIGLLNFRYNEAFALLTSQLVVILKLLKAVVCLWLSCRNCSLSCWLPEKYFQSMLFFSAASRFYHKYSIILVWKMMCILLIGLLLLCTPVNPRAMDI